MSDVEETLKRIQSHKGVQGVIIWNPEGIAIRSTFEPKVTTQARLLPPRVGRAALLAPPLACATGSQSVVTWRPATPHCSRPPRPPQYAALLSSLSSKSRSIVSRAQ